MSDGLKSAYERALERLAEDGIAPPREDSLDPATREQVAEARSVAAARLAELEILHADRLRAADDPTARVRAEEEYVADRSRIEAERDRKIARLRGR